MQFVLAKMETCPSGSVLLRSVYVLYAIRCVVQAWKCVNEVTIMKCFRNAGILRQDFLVVQPMISAEIDPFVDIDDHDLSDLDDTTICDELVEVIHRVHGSENACSLLSVQNLLIVHGMKS